MKKLIPCLLVLLGGVSGCTILENLDGVNTLGQYSREKDDQHRLVKIINDHYDALTRAVDAGRISDYKDAAAVEHSFGDPILKKDLAGGGQRWLYRYAVYRFARDQVYVYFDRGGKLVKWEKWPCQKFF
jgi:hypothetical protein